MKVRTLAISEVAMSSDLLGFMGSIDWWLGGSVKLLCACWICAAVGGVARSSDVLMGRRWQDLGLFPERFAARDHAEGL